MMFVWFFIVCFWSVCFVVWIVVSGLFCVDWMLRFGVFGVWLVEFCVGLLLVVCGWFVWKLVNLLWRVCNCCVFILSGGFCVVVWFFGRFVCSGWVLWKWLFCMVWFIILNGKFLFCMLLIWLIRDWLGMLGVFFWGVFDLLILVVLLSFCLVMNCCIVFMFRFCLWSWVICWKFIGGVFGFMNCLMWGLNGGLVGLFFIWVMFLFFRRVFKNLGFIFCGFMFGGSCCCCLCILVICCFICGLMFLGLILGGSCCCCVCSLVSCCFIWGFMMCFGFICFKNLGLMGWWVIGLMIGGFFGGMFICGVFLVGVVFLFWGIFRKFLFEFMKRWVLDLLGVMFVMLEFCRLEMIVYVFVIFFLLMKYCGVYLVYEGL